MSRKMSLVLCSRVKTRKTFSPELPHGKPHIAFFPVGSGVLFCSLHLDVFYGMLSIDPCATTYNWSSPFFVQPIFRDDGFFMMISQFQNPSHFLMAYLEDYRMDPAAAQPLLTFSIFDDYAISKDLTLVRCDILNRGLHDSEGRKLVENVMESYICDVEYAAVQTFNQRPQSFDVDDFISRQNEKWRKGPPSVSV